MNYNENFFVNFGGYDIKRVSEGVKFITLFHFKEMDFQSWKGAEAFEF